MKTGKINNLTITDPGSAAALSIADGGTLATSGAHSITLNASADTNVTLPASGTLTTGMTGNTVVNFDSSMTASAIQALIDAQPKNLNGNVLTFQFADGTYTLDSTLIFDYFFGGVVYLRGNSSEIAVQTATKSVVLNSSAATAVAINQLYTVIIEGLQIGTSSSVSGATVLSVGDSVAAYIWYNSLAAPAATATSMCVLAAATDCLISNNYFANAQRGIMINNNSEITSLSNLSVSGSEVAIAHLTYGGKLSELSTPAAATTQLRAVYDGGIIVGHDGTIYSEKGAQATVASDRYAKGNISGAVSIDYSNGDYQVCATTATVTGITISNLPTDSGMVLLIDNSSGYSITFGSTEILATSDTGVYFCGFYNDNGTIYFSGKSQRYN